MVTGDGGPPTVRWRADAHWALWPNAAAVGPEVVVTCERWSRLVARRLHDGTTVWDRPGGGSSPVVVGDAVVVRGPDGVRSHSLHDGSPRWSTPLPVADVLHAGPDAHTLIGVGSAPGARGEQLVVAIDATTGWIPWMRRLPGPLTVLVAADTLLAAETGYPFRAGTRLATAHHPDTELVALDLRTGHVRHRWRLPASAASLVATSAGQVVARCFDGSNVRVRTGSGGLESLGATDAAIGSAHPVLAPGGRGGVGDRGTRAGVAVLDPEDAALVHRALPQHLVAPGPIPTPSGVLAGTQEAVVHHLDPVGGALGRVHLGAKRLHGLLPVPPGGGEGPVAVGVTKTGVVAVDLPSNS